MNKIRLARTKRITKAQKIIAAIAAAIFLAGAIGTCVDSAAFISGAEPVEIIEARDRTSKTYYLGDGKYSLDVSLSSVHYEDVYGDWQNIETDIVPSAKPTWDYEVVKGHWHLLVRDDTTIAVGKKGNWLGFRYTAFGYLDWQTKDYHILQTRQDVTPVVEGNKITWPDIFYGADLEYIYTPDGLKENLYISQDTRNYLQLNPPSSYGLNNDSSYLVGVIECDWQLSTFTPEDAAGNPINWDTVQEFVNSGVNWRDPVLEKIITALPIGYAYHEDGEPEDYVDLRYRFYKDGDTHYLLFGAKVLDLNSLPVGTIILDPTVDEQVGASLGDVHEVASGGTVTNHAEYVYHTSHTTSSERFWGGHRWVSGSLPSQGDTVDVAYMELYLGSLFFDDVNGNWHFQKVASPAQFTTTNYDVTGRTRTTASVSWIADSLGSGWKQTPSLVTPLQEVVDSYSPTALVAIFRPNQNSVKAFWPYSYDYSPTYGAKLHIEWTAGVDPPIVVTHAATNIEDTTATLNGEVTDTGGEDPTVTVYWGDEDGGEVPENWDNSSAPTSPSQPQGAATFYKDVTGLPTGTTIYFTARAVNSGGTDWGSTQNFLTKPAAPTNVAATDGDHTDKVVITWTKSTGATGYKIYYDDTLLDTVGDVATYDDTAAPAPTITAGSAVASDGSATAHVSLSLSGTTANNGATRTYKVKAFNGSGDSDDSDTDTGYRGVGALTYQWQRSAADSDADYSNITGATSATYDDTAAPAPTITAGSTVATDGDHTDKVSLSLSGTSTSVGDGRYYQCVLNAAGAVEQTSASNRGYRGVGSLTYQWQRSSGDGDSGYSNISGATTSTYGDTDAPAPTITAGSTVASDGLSTNHVALSLSGTSTSEGDGRYYRCVLNAAGADQEISTSDRGYRTVGSLTYQWQRSAADSDADYSNISGATSSAYDDTDAPAGTITAGSTVASDGLSTEHVALSLSGTSANNGDGRYYRCVLNAAGAVQQTSASDRGYRGIGSLTYQWQRSANDSDAEYSNITGATMAAHNDTAAPTPTITAGNATASDGTSDEYVTLELENEAGNNGDGRYYQCVLNAAGAASSETSTSDRGYRGSSTLSYQWYRSFSDAAGNYSAISGGTSVPYNDTGGVYEPDGRYYLCELSMTDAVSQNSTADRGYMLVPTAPTVTCLEVTQRTGNTALLRGEITDTGGKNATMIGFEWGISSGNYTYSWNSTGAYGVGIFTRTITGLLINTQYYYRAYATNEAGTNYSAECDFLTLDLPLAPTDFTITQVGIGSIEITWTMGIGANTTIIVASESGYPESIDDGYIVYSGNATSAVLSGLTFDTTMYYYRAWSQNQYGYSLDYAEASIGNPVSVASIFFVIALCGFALWKRSWIRIMLAICILIWAVFVAQYDMKIAAPLLVIGTLLFVSDIITLWQSYREREPAAKILTPNKQDSEVLY